MTFSAAEEWRSLFPSCSTVVLTWFPACQWIHRQTSFLDLGEPSQVQLPPNAKTTYRAHSGDLRVSEYGFLKAQAVFCFVKLRVCSRNQVLQQTGAGIMCARPCAHDAHRALPSQTAQLALARHTRQTAGISMAPTTTERRVWHCGDHTAKLESAPCRRFFVTKICCFLLSVERLPHLPAAPTRV